MPRSLAPRIATLGFTVQDVRDVGLRGATDTKISEKAIAADSIIITRDRDFANVKHWPLAFTAGVIFVNLPDDTPVSTINSKVTDLLAKRLPESLLGALTIVELHRALARSVRRTR